MYTYAKKTVLKKKKTNFWNQYAGKTGMKLFSN